MSLVTLALVVLIAICRSQHSFSYYNSTGPYTIANGTSDGYPIWYPVGSDKRLDLPIYVFVAGTGADPQLYSQTLALISSHGFVSVGSWMEGNHDGIHCVKSIQEGKLKWPANMNGIANTSLMVTGGHSGGGPVALWAGVGGNKNKPQNEPYIHGYVAQHGASIPFINEPTKKQFEAINAPIFTSCGQYDTVAYCTCFYAEHDYYDKTPESQGRIYIEAPDTHVTGTQGVDGRDYEGGFVTAFLSYTLLNDLDAKKVLSENYKNYTIHDQL